MKKKSRKSQKKASSMLLHERRAAKKGFRIVAGIDESGRGPLAGPVVACCCVLKSRRFKNYIDDCKKLSPLSRQKAYLEIVKKTHFGVGIVSEKVIDRINILNATGRAMEIAIKNLSTVTPDIILVDGRVRINTSHNKVFIIKGDEKSLSIACASIIAKITRDKIMKTYDNRYPQYGFSRHKGYPTSYHFKAIRDHGPLPIHRKSFYPFSNKKTRR